MGHIALGQAATRISSRFKSAQPNIGVLTLQNDHEDFPAESLDMGEPSVQTDADAAVRVKSRQNHILLAEAKTPTEPVRPTAGLTNPPRSQRGQKD